MEQMKPKWRLEPRELQYELFSIDITYPKEKPKRHSIETKIIHWGIPNGEKVAQELDYNRNQSGYTVKG